MNAAALQRDLCATFCSDLTVEEVPAGYAVSARFQDDLGDRVSCYVILDQGAPYLADDGAFIGEMLARGLDVFGGQRAEFLERVLRPAGAYVDQDAMEIRTAPFPAVPGAADVFDFLSALVRARDVAFWTREIVRSTFVEDAVRALSARLANRASIERDVAVSDSLADFPPDVLITPTGVDQQRLAVFLAQSVDRMNEALLLWLEAQRQGQSQVRVAALVEDGNAVPVGHRRVLRAVNRIDAFAIFRTDEQAAVERVLRPLSGP